MTPSIVWSRLLWKDYRQVLPALIGSSVMLACLLIVYLVMQLIAPGRDMTLFSQAYAIVLLAPVFSAIACSGLLIGHERQTRTWNWTSSLPVGWRRALTSKAVVWFASSVLMLVCLVCFYALLWQAALQFGRTASSPAQSGWQLVSITVEVASLEIFVIFSIASLLWNDTLLAMAGAAVVVIAGQVAMIILGPWLVGSHHVPFEQFLSVASVLTIIVILVATVGLCFAFRWRWSTGQLSSVHLLPILGANTGARSHQAEHWQAYAKRGKRPSELRMMLVHSMRSGLGLRLTIIGFVLVLTFLSGTAGLAMAAVSASLLIGTSAFSNDRALGRDRFFADRGSSWAVFLFAKTLPACLSSLAVFVIIAIASQELRSDVPLLGFAAMLLTSFGTGLFASLCMSNAVIAVTIGGLSAVVCALCYTTVAATWFAWTGDREVVFAGLPLSLLILMVGIILQTRRVLIWDNPRSLGPFLSTLATAVFVPLLLCVGLGFLRVPSVPWEGASIERLSPSYDYSLPAFDVPTPAAPKAFSTLSYFAHPHQQPQFDTYYEAALGQIEGLGSWLEDWTNAIPLIQAELERASELQPAVPSSEERHSQLIESTALVGTLATRARKSELALAAWQLNRDLLQLGATNVQLAERSVGPRTITYLLWTQLRDSDIQFLAEHVDVEDLLPSPVAKEQWADALKQHWTMRKIMLDHGHPDDFKILTTEWMLHWMLPLRWYVDRKMALQLSRELRTLDAPYPHPPYPSVADSLAADDPLYIQLSKLYDLQNRVKQRIESLEEQ